MMTSWNGNIFRVTGPLCGEFTGHRWIFFPAQRPVTRSFDVFFDLDLNKPLSKQLWGWWLETQSHSLWRHCNDMPCRYPKAGPLDHGDIGLVNAIRQRQILVNFLCLAVLYAFPCYTGSHHIKNRKHYDTYLLSDNLRQQNCNLDLIRRNSAGSRA